MNPIATMLTKAKNASLSLDDALLRINELEKGFDSALYAPEAKAQSEEILLIYHERTLAQLCYLRRKLTSEPTEVDQFLAGVTLGVMHGSERKDGTSSYASISMPNTFSMSPDYVKRYVETKRLQRVFRNVFDLLRAKCKRLFKEGPVEIDKGHVRRADIRDIPCLLKNYIDSVDLVVTSPPYLNVVSYANQNWIRTWFLSEDPKKISQDLDDDLTLSEWIDFAEMSVGRMKKMMREGGVITLVIGDVAKSDINVISLARELMRRLMSKKAFAYIGCLSDHLNTEEKTTRIWKETKGKATEVDRIVILSDKVPSFNHAQLASELYDDKETTEVCSYFNSEQLQSHANDFVA